MKAVKNRLFVMAYAAIAGITAMLIMNHDSTPEAVEYMAKVKVQQTQTQVAKANEANHE